MATGPQLGPRAEPVRRRGPGDVVHRTLVAQHDHVGDRDLLEADVQAGRPSRDPGPQFAVHVSGGVDDEGVARLRRALRHGCTVEADQQVVPDGGEEQLPGRPRPAQLRERGAGPARRGVGVGVVVGAEHPGDEREARAALERAVRDALSSPAGPAQRVEPQAAVVEGDRPLRVDAAAERPVGGRGADHPAARRRPCIAGRGVVGVDDLLDEPGPGCGHSSRGAGYRDRPVPGCSAETGRAGTGPASVAPPFKKNTSAVPVCRATNGTDSASQPNSSVGFVVRLA